MRDHTDLLINRGSAYPELFDAIEDFHDEFDAPVCILAFQLPFRLHTADETYGVSGKGLKTAVHFRFLPIRASISPDFRVGVSALGSESTDPAASEARSSDCTQCIAAMPLWGTRLEYYDRYLDLVRRRRPDDVLIPSHLNPYLDPWAGALTAHMFEANMAERTLKETKIAIRTFLLNYMIVTLDEITLEGILYSLFAVTATDRVFGFGPNYSIGYGLVVRPRSTAIRTATAETITAALKWPIRDFASFELQIFALKRLADGGEPALALVGLMALVEWYLKENLPNRGRERFGLKAILRHPHYEFVPERIKTAIDSHREARNVIIHERPTDKTTYYDLHPGHPLANAGANAFYEAAAAAFELYRLVNMQGRRESRPDAG